MITVSRVSASMTWKQSGEKGVLVRWSCAARGPVKEPHSDDPVGAMASPNAVQTLQETDEAIEEDPVPTATHPGTCSLPINIPVPLPNRRPLGPSGRQQEEASPPELQRLDQTVEAEERIRYLQRKSCRESERRCVCVPEVLRASRTDVLVQVVPLVLLQPLVAKLHPAGHKVRIRVRRAEAVAVLDLCRLVRVPETRTSLSQRTLFFGLSL